MKQFILSYTWFALNTIFKYSGLDLLSRDGDTRLKLSSACRFWTRLVCTHLVVLSGMIATFCYIVYFETTPENLMKNAMEKVFTSVTTTFAMCSQNFWMLGLNFIGVTKMRCLSKKLVGIQEYFNQYALIDEQLTKKCLKEFLWKASPYMAIMFIGYSVACMTSFALLMSDLKVSTFWIGILVTCGILVFFVYLSPIWYFVFMYTEVSLEINLIIWKSLIPHFL